MIPHDLAAEDAVIAGILIRPDTIPELADNLTPEDFYSPGRGELWHIAVEAWKNGTTPDGNYLAAHSTKSTDAREVIADALTNPVTLETCRTNALRVADLAAVRRTQSILSGGLDTISGDPNHDPADLIDHLTAELGRVDIPNDTRPIDGLWSAGDLIAADFPLPPEVIPGFLRQGDRLMLVGLEGSGKTVLMRYMLARAAQGKHPLTGARILPRRCLYIDLENGIEDARDGLALVNAREGDPLWILSRPGGIDMRTRTDRSLIHRTCEQIRPEVIAIGPVYKMGRRRNDESDEDFATAIQHELEVLRVRFGCALILEHHAPKGIGKSRDLVPFGSSAWLRWPEMGWKLIPHNTQYGKDHPDGESLRVGLFRRDRRTIIRPERFDRAPGGWCAVFPTGTLRDPRQKPSSEHSHSSQEPPDLEPF